MTRSRLAVFATVSAFALLALSTASEAVTPPAMNLGLLKPQEQWKIGTVNTGGLAYCAMVNKFDKHVVLAFARNTDGFGSVAIDFRESFLEPALDYEVVLKPYGQQAKHLVGKASSDRSIVVQVGEDADFFRQLSTDGNLEIGLPAIDATFALRKFSSGYKKLVDCADRLAAEKAVVKELGGTAMQVVDQEAAAIIAERTQVASAEPAPAVKAVKAVKPETKTAEVQKPAAPAPTAVTAIATAVENKAGSGLDALLEREAEERANAFTQKLAALDTRKKELEDRIVAAQEQERATTPAPAPAPATEGPAPERKLLASAGAAGLKAATVKPGGLTADSGAIAREIERQQLAMRDRIARERDAQQSATLRLDMERKQRELAALEAEKAKAADAQVAAFAAKDAALKTQIADAGKARDALQTRLDLQPPAAAQEERRPLKAQLVNRQAEIAALDTQRAAESQALTEKLSSTQAEYESRLQSLRAERDGLRQQLQQVQTQTQAPVIAAPAADNAKVREMESRLAAAEQEKRTLLAQMEALGRQNRQVQDAAPAPDLHARVATLQQALAEQSLQYDRVRAELDAARPAAPATQGAQTAALEQQLRALETERREEAARAAQAQADLAAARRQIADLKAGLAAAPEVVPAVPETVAGLAPVPARSSAHAFLSGFTGYGGHDAADAYKVPEQKKSAENFPVPAAPAAPVEAREAASDKSNGIGNRAAAFLEGVMTHHRGGGAPDAPAPVAAVKGPSASAATPESAAPVLAEAGTRKGEASFVGRIKSVLSGLRSGKEEASKFEVPAAAPAPAPAVVPVVEDKPAVQVAELKVPDAPLSGALKGSVPPPAFSTPVPVKNTAETEIAWKAERPAAVAGVAKATLAQARDEIVWAAPRASGPSVAAAEPVAVVSVPVKTAAASEEKEILWTAPPAATPPVTAVRPAPAPVKTVSAVTEAVTKAETAALTQAGPEIVWNAERPAAAPPLKEGTIIWDSAAAPVMAAQAEAPPERKSAPLPLSARGLETVRAETKTDVVPLAPVAAAESFAPPADRPGRVTLAENDKVAPPMSDAQRAAAEVLSTMEPASGVPAAAFEPPAPVRHTPFRLTTRETAAGSAPVLPTFAAALEHQKAAQRQQPQPQSEKASPSGVIRLSSEEAAQVKAGRAAASADVPAAMGRFVALEDLLAAAGLGRFSFLDAPARPGENIRQWTNGRLNGMFEQIPVSGGDFATQVESYLDRYRADCPGQLKTQVSPPRHVRAGSVAVAGVACAMPSNAYNSSFVFLRDRTAFNAILHTGFPDDGVQVREIAGRIAGGLVSSTGFAAAPAPQLSAAAPEFRPAAAQEPELKFNIRDIAPASGGKGAFGDEFETVVVQ